MKILIACFDFLKEYQIKHPSGNIKFALPSVLTQKLHARKTFDDKLAEVDGNFFFIARDSFRIGTLQLLAEEIRNRNVEGEIAELGVFQGNFSKHLNQLFPDRTLNLFDTFEGFDSRDIVKDSARKQTIDSAKLFKETSIDLVMSKMKYPEQIQIHKGYFPSTIPSEDKVFALVSLDVDLYAPALEGLKYFYPRLSTGGYIMIHDYNDIGYSQSIHKAIDEFEAKFGHVVKVPISDNHGTIIISK